VHLGVSPDMPWSSAQPGKGEEPTNKEAQEYPTGNFDHGGGVASRVGRKLRSWLR